MKNRIFSVLLIATSMAVISSEAQERGRGGNRNARPDPQRGGDRGGADMDAIRKRIEAGVKSGKIKREDASKWLEGLRNRMEAAKRGGEDKKEEGKQDPRLARYRATEREIATAVKAGKLSKKDAQKKLLAVRKQLWSSNTSRSSQPKGSTRSKSSSSPSSHSSQSRGSSRSRTSSQGAQQQSSRGYLGASVETSSRPKGLRIRQVYANTAAARAKLKKGDIILKMNGSSVTSNSALIGRLSKTKPGQKATLLVLSGGKTKTVQIQLGRSYSTRASAQSGSTKSRSSSKSNSSQPKSPSRSKSSSSPSSRSSQTKSSQSRGSSRSHTPQRSSGTDWRKAIEERLKQAREAREKAERDSRRAPQSRGSSRSRTPQRSSGTDWRKAIEERMKKAREAQEKAERDSQGRDNDRGRNDRGEDMRKAWEERMKQWQQMRERGNNDPQRGPQWSSGRFRSPGAGRGPQRGGPRPSPADRGSQGQNWRGRRGR